MKKLALITLTTLVCLCLAGCADDTVTPNELTAPVTPNEVIEQPVVTHNESEPPAEPETPIEPEIPAEPEDNVIMLPEADENTIKYTLEFPEDFPMSPYREVSHQKNNIVSVDEFDFGINALEIEYATAYNMQRYCYPVIAFLGNGIRDLEEGTVAYNKYRGIDSQPKYNKWYEESSIQIESYEMKNYNNALVCKCIDLRNHNGDNWVYSFYSPDLSKKIYELSVKDFFSDNSINTWINITQIIDTENVVIELYFQGQGSSAFSAYKLHLPSGKWDLIKPYAYNAVFSPDGKYLAYSTPSEDLWDFLNRNYKDHDINYDEKGYYIEELETGKVIYYPTPNHYTPYLNWVSADVLN